MTKMKNLLDKQRKYYRKQKFIHYRAGFISCLIIIALIICPLYDKYRRERGLAPLKQTITNPIVEVRGIEDKYTQRGYKRCYDPIICIRDIGEEMNFSNQDILIAIRIARAESGLRPDAINKNSNGSFDIGIFQINDIHSKRISRQDRFDFEKNIQFAWNLRKEQGDWNAWSVCQSKVNCLVNY